MIPVGTGIDRFLIVGHHFIFMFQSVMNDNALGTVVLSLAELY